MKVAIAFIVIFSLASFSYSQSTYSYSFYNNGTCQSTQVGSCTPCQYYAGYPVYYFAIVPSPYSSSGYEAYQYYDAECTELYSYANFATERCSSTNAWENCMFFSQIQSTTTLSLTLSSTEPIVVSFIGDDSYYSQISANKVTAQGENLAGVQVHSGGKNFFVERQVSSTQYSTSIGIFTIGETYTHAPFTFSVITSEIDFPLPPVSSGSLTTVSFEPFFSAQVTGDNTYPTYHEDNAEIVVFVDGSYSLDGLVFSNPFYSIQNLTFYPPFQSNNNHGELVFQLEASSSPFLTVQCYHNSYYIGSTSQTANTYECEMGSLSGIIYYGSFLSFSLDEFGEQKIRQPDEMSFSLF